MQFGTGHLNRRNASSKRIEPELPFSGDTMFNRFSAISGGTRPPVVGREMTLDPERSKRYDSTEDHLSKYLRTLEQKTAAGQQQGSALSDDDISDISLSSIGDPKSLIIRKNTQFLKPNVPKISVKDPGPSTAPRSMAINFQTSRTSSALQKAQTFSNKYKPLRKTSDEEIRVAESREKLHVEVPLYKAESVSHSTSSSSGTGLLNVKDLIDLPSLSDVSLHSSPSQRSELGNARLSSQINNFEDSQQIPSVSESSLISHHSTVVSSESSSEVPSEYEEDFEEESYNSDNSSLASEGSQSDKGTKTESTQSESGVAGALDGKSSMDNQSQASVQMKRKIPLSVKTTPALYSHPQIQNNVCKETQTTSILAREDPASNIIIVRNFPTAQPYYMEGVSLHTLPVPALDEMMRQHLSTIRLFKESQRKSYETLVTALKPNFQYTTWERTQKVLDRQRQRRHTKK